MKEINPLGPRTPLHFVVPFLHHFHVREDLLEEFCLAEVYTTFLPRSEKYHEWWLRSIGRTAEELPFSYVAPFAKERYQLTPRYILAAEVMPRTRHRTNILVDERGLPQVMQHRGLFLFVIERAIAFCALRGISESVARQKLLPAYPREAPQSRIESEWAIGLERETGYCTVLIRGSESEARFLSDASGWLTPFPSS